MKIYKNEIKRLNQAIKACEKSSKKYKKLKADAKKLVNYKSFIEKRIWQIAEEKASDVLKEWHQNHREYLKAKMPLTLYKYHKNRKRKSKFNIISQTACNRIFKL